MEIVPTQKSLLPLYDWKIVLKCSENICSSPCLQDMFHSIDNNCSFVTRRVTLEIISHHVLIKANFPKEKPMFRHQRVKVSILLVKISKVFIYLLVFGKHQQELCWFQRKKFHILTETWISVASNPLMCIYELCR